MIIIYLLLMMAFCICLIGLLGLYEAVKRTHPQLFFASIIIFAGGIALALSAAYIYLS